MPGLGLVAEMNLARLRDLQTFALDSKSRGMQQLKYLSMEDYSAWEA